MKKTLQKVCVAIAVMSTMALGVPAAQANDTLYVTRDGDVKAYAYYNAAANQVCANLNQGSLATASLAGAYANDYTANGVPECTGTSMQRGDSAPMRLTWRGTSGAILSSGPVTIRRPS